MAFPKPPIPVGNKGELMPLDPLALLSSLPSFSSGATAATGPIVATQSAPFVVGGTGNLVGGGGGTGPAGSVARPPLAISPLWLGFIGLGAVLLWRLGK